MEHTQKYTHLSVLLASAKAAREEQDTATGGKGAEVLWHIQELLRAIEIMSTDEREMLMSVLNGWIITEKFKTEKYPVLFGLQKFCISACLGDNPDWRPPRDR